MSAFIPPHKYFEEELLRHLLADPSMQRRFAILLGAGCSASSGVPLASGILNDAKAELYRAFNQIKASDAEQIEDWLNGIGKLRNSKTAYGEALEWFRPNLRLRRIFLEKYFQDKEPSPAHLAFASLIAKGVFGSIYTTNFDDLIEKAFRKIGTIRVVTHDEQAADVDLHSEIPTLFKLHGDYLFDRLANTQLECSELPKWEAEKLKLSLTEGGLIVVGYSGTDQSIMSILEQSSQNGVPLGLFWLGRKGDTPSTIVTEFISTHPNARYCPIEGFDEFITSLFIAMMPREGGAAYSLNSLSTQTQRPFVAHDGGLLKLKKDAILAIETSGCPIIIISGLPGAGKTTIAQKVVQQLKGSFFSLIEISAKNKPFNLAEVLDECRKRFGVGQVDRLDAEQIRESVINFLARNKTLMFLDNFEIISAELFDFLKSIPEPSKVLLTLRTTPPELTQALNQVVEFVHEGLTDEEMTELLNRLSNNSHELRRKFQTLDSQSIAEIIQGLRGWPQALVLFLAKLNNPTVPASEYRSLLSSSDLYTSLLEDTYTHLTQTGRIMLRCAAAFPATISIDSLSAISNYNATRVKIGIEELVERGLIISTSNSRFSFSHPIVSSFSRSKIDNSNNKNLISLARNYLTNWTNDNGGQPTSDWSNFQRLDYEFENIKVLLVDLKEHKNYTLLTSIFRNIFSYVVERGHWLYMDSVCDEILQTNVTGSLKADWLIWKSWIAFYLRGNYVESAKYAADVFELRRVGRRQLFEAHRRAALAYSFSHDFTTAAEQLEHAKSICQKSWSVNSHQHIDLSNLTGQFWLQNGSNKYNTNALQKAWRAFDQAEKLSLSRRNPNTREIGVSLIGKARVHELQGKIEEALSLARMASEHAWSIGWLRGIAESNELLSRLALKTGNYSLSTSANKLADGMFQSLGKISKMV